MSWTKSSTPKLTRIWGPFLALTLVGAACTPTMQERGQALSEDGLFLFKKGNYSAARESFQSALAVQPTNSALLYNIGKCSEKMGDPQTAEKVYLDCLQKNPDHPLTRHALCGLMISQNRQSEARQFVADWLNREPRSSSALAADGWLTFKEGNVPEAQAKLQTALEWNNRDTTALMALGQVFEVMGRPDRALALYERAYEIDPTQTDLEGLISKLKLQGVGKPRID